jgi:hypothetical protein
MCAEPKQRRMKSRENAIFGLSESIKAQLLLSCSLGYRFGCSQHRNVQTIGKGGGDYPTG